MELSYLVIKILLVFFLISAIFTLIILAMDAHKNNKKRKNH
jgi:hypothetical protein